MTQVDADLSLPAMPVLRWSDGATTASLDELRAWAERLADEAIAWYTTEKRGKARWSRALRRLAVVLATAGGAVPVAALAANRPALGNWGYVLLAIAAGAVAYDRFFGYSSAWQRYMTTSTALRGQLAEFRLAWTVELVQLADRQPSTEETARLVGTVATFVTLVNETIQAETDSWRVEFHAGLTELESQLRDRAGERGKAT